MTHDRDPDGPKRFPRWLGFSLVVLFLPLVLVFLAGNLLYGLLLHVAVWALWLPKGKSTLIVTSDSPVWSEFMAYRIVGVLQPVAFVLNWSERSRWPRVPSLPVMVFRFFGGGREFNPLVVAFRPLRVAKVFRFWNPFREFKHGRSRALEALTEQALEYCRGLNTRAA